MAHIVFSNCVDAVELTDKQAVQRDIERFSRSLNGVAPSSAFLGAISDAGFNLQIDSPDMAMAAHCRSVGGSVGDWHRHLPLAVEALNTALGEIPPEQVRLHVCWGNYAGPHHMDVPLEQIIGEVLKVRAGTIYVEGANPRHAHEWRVFEDVELAGTDCGFDTFIRFSQVDPAVALLKLRSLSDGADLASAEL